MESINIPYNVSYRSIKYPRLEFGTGTLLLVLPYGYEAEKVINKHKRWINKKCKFIEECLKEAEGIEINPRSEEKFRDMVCSLGERSAEELNVEIKNIFFRVMKTKWASCSTKKNLTINKLMKYLPEHLLEYVIFHEVAHLLERTHSDKFWEIISMKYPNYQKLERGLFVYWFKLTKRTL